MPGRLIKHGLTFQSVRQLLVECRCTTLDIFMVGNYKLLIRHNELRQFDKHLKMSKSVQAALLFGLVVAVLCHGPPDPLDSLWDTASAVMYNQLKLATEVDTTNNTKQLLLE